MENNQAILQTLNELEYLHPRFVKFLQLKGGLYNYKL